MCRALVCVIVLLSVRELKAEILARRKAMVRKRFIFTGRVQGVGFRTRAQYAARGMCITGWVKNEWDGSVVMEAQGAEKAIDQMLIMINRSDYICIDSIESENIPLVESESSFTAIY